MDQKTDQFVTPISASQWINEEKKYCAQNYSPLPVVLCKGEGVWLWDLNGKKYLDMMSAYSANSFGHCHPQLVHALHDQSKKLCLVSRAFYAEPLLPFLKKLCEFSGFEQALPMNTGVEAVETAIKAARRWGYRKKGIPPNQAEIIVAKNNFHGRTLSVISFSSEPTYKADFGPFTPGFVEIPFGDASALENTLSDKTCAFLVEPIQGEAGIVVPPAGFLKDCEMICRKNNILLIVDEIQSGLGRTGKRFAFEYDDIHPDGIILGKALGGGLLPVSAFVARREILDLFEPGSHGSTFGGNPLAARIGFEALTLLEQSDYIARSATLGKVFLEALQSIQHPAIKAVRGKGLWVGVEFNRLQGFARQVCEKMIEKGILAKDVHETTIRFAPPLIIEEKELLWTVSVFEAALKSMA